MRIRPAYSTAIAVGAAAAVLVACRSMSTAEARPPVALAPKVDIPRFMGDWYVIASIPTVFEKGAHNAKDSYALRPDGSIDVTFTYRDGSFDGPAKDMGSRAFVQSASGAVWGVQFVWPIKADYRISHVADDYSVTVITRDKRDHVWIMARTKTLPEAELQRLIAFAGAQGYDTTKIERAPQR